LISQLSSAAGKESPVVIDTKLTRAEAALTRLLDEDQQDQDSDVVTLTTTYLTSIDTFHSNLAAGPLDQFTSDEELQQKLMVGIQS